MTGAWDDPDISRIGNFTISQGFIYGAAVVFTESFGKPYIEINKISFWIENCDVSVSSLAFKNTIPAYTYILGKNSITTSAYGTNIVPECADHVTYDYTVSKKVWFLN